MTRIRLITLAIAISASLSAPAVAQAPAGIARVAWLKGCWELASPQRTVEEHWMAPRGRTMIGSGRTVRGDQLIEYELVIIREQGDRLAYEAHPSGQPSAVFQSTTISDTTAIFENSEHDFPQRVGYRLDKPDALVAWIEGTSKGQPRRVEFPYARVACPGR
jgi:hypothetical protein